MSLKCISFFIFFVAMAVAAVMLISFSEYSGLEKGYQIGNEDISEKVANQDEITDEEKEFNESGRAKAIEEEEDFWQYYENEEAGFSFSYPYNVVLSDANNLNMDNDGEQYYLTVRVEDIETLNGTMNYDKETALINQKTLLESDYGNDVDFPLEVSKKVRGLGKVNAQDFMVLMRFDVCDVVFERKLYFFNNNKQIIITLYGPKDSFLKSLGRYLKIDETMCGDYYMWDFDNNTQESFYDDLVGGKAPENTQEWYDVFNQIVNTIEFSDEESGSNNLENIKGRWSSVDDVNSIIEFTNNKKIDYYGDEKISESSFGIYDSQDLDNMKEDEYGDYLVIDFEGEKAVYEIDWLDDNSLKFIYLERGNSLHYKKIFE